MVKLQLRLDQAQTDTILKALDHLARYPDHADGAIEARRLAPWLSWRRAKIWPQPTSEDATPAAELDLCRMCDTRHVTANEPCAICQFVSHCAMTHDLPRQRDGKVDTDIAG